MLKAFATIAALATLTATTLAPAHASIEFMNGASLNGWSNGGSGNGANENGRKVSSSTLSIQAIELPSETR